MRRLGLLLVVLVLAAACTGDDAPPDDGAVGSSTTSTGVPIPGGRVVVGLESEPDALDPARNLFGVSALTAALAVYDPLLTHDADGEVVPYLAASLSRDEAGTRWVIRLRPDVEFSDGTPLDAAAVAAGFDRQLDSEVLRTALRDLQSVSVIDELTLEVRTRPAPDFADLLAGQVGLVASPTMTDPRRPIGTGPFVLQSWQPGDRMVLARNPTHWRRGAGLPYLDELELRPIPGVADRRSALERGEVDVIHLTDDDGKGARRRLLVLNPDDPLFDAVGCRRAVVAAVVDDVAGGGEGDEGDDCGERIAFTVRADVGDGVTAPLVETWGDAGMTVTVEQRDAGRLVLDELLGDFQALLRDDDGLLDVDRRLVGGGDDELTEVVLDSTGWVIRTADGVAGDLGRLPLPDGAAGEAHFPAGVVVPSALHRVAVAEDEK